MRRWPVLAFLAVVIPGCGGDDGRTEIWIYTSIYPQVIERLAPRLEAALPGVDLRWVQKGSEQVAAVLNAEIASGRILGDVLLTSDPFYYAELAAAGHFLPHASAGAAAVPAAFRDPGGAFTAVRVPLMVIAVNHDRIPAGGHPRSFADLAGSGFPARLSMGDPLKSGTCFTAVAALARTLGWEWFERLRAGGFVAAGGNSAVLQRLETGERPVGIVLLEDVLPRIAKGAPLTVIYPEDGAIPVPSPVAILRATRHPEIARRIQDLLFTPELQAAIVEGRMYSPLPESAPPAGARPWRELKLFPWDAAFFEATARDREAIKQRFREVMRG